MDLLQQERDIVADEEADALLAQLVRMHPEEYVPDGVDADKMLELLSNGRCSKIAEMLRLRTGIGKTQ